MSVRTSNDKSVSIAAEQQLEDHLRAQQQKLKHLRANHLRESKQRQNRLAAQHTNGGHRKRTKRPELKDVKSHGEITKARKEHEADAKRKRAFATQAEIIARGGVAITDQGGGGGGGGGGHQGGEEQRDDQYPGETPPPRVPDARLSHRKRGPTPDRALADAGIPEIVAGAVPAASCPDVPRPHGTELAQLAQGLLAARDLATGKSQAPVRPVVAGLVSGYMRATHRMFFEELEFDEVKRVLLEADSKRAKQPDAVPTQADRELNLLMALIVHNATRPAPDWYRLRAAAVAKVAASTVESAAAPAA
ncbi:hypothetical protein [Paraburkholderia sp. CI3]|uniref:hypothetical protein n=1 Tax=Paraburkholderia sp. CI3 TaxID=2991060 RepID=UPI003D23636B